MSDKISSREYSQGLQHYSKSKTGGQIYGLNIETCEGWIPRTGIGDVVLWTTKFFQHKSDTMAKTQFPAHSENSTSEHARAGN